MFYCQHVLGIGHLVRSAEIVRELARDSHVLLVTGGEIPDGFRLPENIDTLQLTPLKTSPDFSSLQLCDFSRGLEETREIRRTLLLQAFDDFKPDVLVTELFPFGRKHFRFELLPLLERARSQQSHRTLVVSSVRDILVARKDQEEYEERVCNLVNSFYDLVLVHGDEKFLKLDESFSRVSDLRCTVAYTGYVVQQNKPDADKSCGFPVVEQNRPAIVVSNGSGQYLTGQMLLESVLRAAQLLQGQIPHEFNVFAGPLMPDESYNSLQTLAVASGNVRLSRYTPDLAAVLKSAELSVSMAGYNTVMDILSSGVRALVYPVTSNGDQEQSVRAEKLARMGVLELIQSEELAPEKLAQKLGAALHNEPTRLALNRSGAANSALLLRKYLAMHRDHVSDVAETQLCSREQVSSKRNLMRLMVYSHDTFGLGNIRRMLAICKHLHASIPDLSILIVSGSPMLQSFRVEPGIDYIKLPCLKRTELGELGVRFLDLDVSAIIRLRRELILSTVMSYRPDVLFVDKKPDGLAGELEPSLRYIKCSLANTRMHLVLRDILDSSRVTIDEWKRHGYYNILQWYYDEIVVLGNQGIFDVCEEYQFPQGLRDKVHHCGYVQRQPPGRSHAEVRKELGIALDERLVLVTTGGGQDGYELLSTALAATHNLASRLPVKTLLVTGPELSSEQKQAIRGTADSQEGLRVIEFTDDLLSYMNAADVVISMAGYNTICELLTLGKRSIVVPRVKPVEEQKIRAERLAGLGAFRMILPGDLTPQTLESALEDELQLAQSRVPVPARIDLGALPRITEILQKQVSTAVRDYGVAAVSKMLAPAGSEW